MGCEAAVSEFEEDNGVIGLTRSAAVDDGSKGIQVNAVLPGMTDTPMVGRAPTIPELAEMFKRVQASAPIQRLGEPIEIAHATAWLLSDASKFITGVTLPVDGGYLAI
jgi:NAD(P)-dependent dehydrogenase (short-subunit alcohol dehydrogenase family)